MIYGTPYVRPWIQYRRLSGDRPAFVWGRNGGWRNDERRLLRLGIQQLELQLVSRRRRVLPRRSLITVTAPGTAATMATATTMPTTTTTVTTAAATTHNNYNNGYNSSGYHANNYSHNTNVSGNTVNVNNANRQNASADRSDASASSRGWGGSGSGRGSTAFSGFGNHSGSVVGGGGWGDRSASSRGWGSRGGGGGWGGGGRSFGGGGFRWRPAVTRMIFCRYLLMCSRKLGRQP